MTQLPMLTSSQLSRQRPATKYIQRVRPLTALPSHFSHQHMRAQLLRKQLMPEIMKKGKILTMSSVKSKLQ